MELHIDREAAAQLRLRMLINKSVLAEAATYFAADGEPYPRALRYLLCGRYEVDAYLANAADERHPDGVQIVLATDTGRDSNQAVLKEIEGFTLAFYGFSTSDGFLCTKIAKHHRLVGSASNRVVAAAITLSAGSSTEAANLPEDLEQAVLHLPKANEKTAELMDKVEHWDAYLKISEAEALKSQLLLAYRSVTQKSRQEAIFSVNGEKLQGSHMGSSVQLVTGQYEEDGVPVYEGPLVGTVTAFGPASLTLSLEEGTLAEDLPAAGRLYITKFGDLAQIRRFRGGLQTFARGRAANPYLDAFLFDAAKARPMGDYEPLKTEELLFQGLNEHQKIAVEGALNSPDLFLIQGPPGTGKTTVIAEICYQNAIRGKKTLIASQTNLAVDNALSKLNADPNIRALRKGNAHSVQQEGLQFTEDRVVETWLGTAQKHSSALQKEQEEKWAAHLALKDGWHTALEQFAAYAEALDTCKGLEARGKKLEETILHKQEFVNSFEEMAGRFLAVPDEAFCQWLRRFEADFDVEALTEACGRIVANRTKIADYGDYMHTAKNMAAALDSAAQPLIARVGAPPEVDGRLFTMEEALDGYMTLLAQLEQAVQKQPGALRTALGLTARFEQRSTQLLREYAAFSGGLRRSVREWEALRHAALQEEEAGEDKAFLQGTIGQIAARFDNEIDELYEKLRDAGREMDETVERQRKLQEEIEAYNRRLGLTKPFAQLLEEADLEAVYQAQWANRARRCKAVLDFLRRWTEKVGQTSNYAALKQVYIDNANVIGITCSQSGSREFSEQYPTFDVAIIDEVSKATPPELILPLLKAKKIVLVGDHKQLPPMIGMETYEEVAKQLQISEAETVHMKESLFESLYKTAPDGLKVMLNTQYRMHSQIMDTINQFYADQRGLVCGLADDSAARRHNCGGLLLAEDTHVMWVDMPNTPACYEQMDGASFYNPAEAQAVLALLRRLNENLEANGYAGKKEVGVITFYSAQVQLFERTILPHADELSRLSLRIGSVDKFQGMEKEIIVCSFVRNNPHGNIGFAKDERRINVALSRAKELLAVVGCAGLFCRQQTYQTVYHIVKENGGVVDAQALSGR